MSDEKETAEENPIVPELPPALIPPVYSRQLKLFGIVIWSDTRQLDEEVFYDRIASRIDQALAKEIMTIKSKR